MSNGQIAASPAPGPVSGRVDAAPPQATRSRRRLLVRFAAWGTGAVAAVTIAVLAVQAATGSRSATQTADALTRQMQGLQQAAQEAGRELRRLSAAIETLNRDRDRLFARVTALEHDADVATGSIPGSTIAKTDAARPPTDRAAAVPAAVQAEATTKIETKAEANAKTEIKAKPVSPDPWTMAATDPAAPAIPVGHTEFGIDLGAASTVNGLRRLWAAALKTHKDDLAPLSPALAVRERPGGRVEFRLLAGPLRDAADAARLCATVATAKRPCTPAVFDGQRLELTEAKAEATSPARRTQSRAAEPIAALPRQ
mgnify:CR=1 FL=1